MTDREIIGLFLMRSEGAIAALRQKYAPLCLGIARRALGNAEDAEECLNDVCLDVWNSIPPEEPESLYAYVGKLARRAAVDKFRYRMAGKRRTGLSVSLEELAACLPDDTAEGTLDHMVLRDTLNAFLAACTPEDRAAFVLRYWYGYDIKQVAARLGLSGGAVRTRLCRMRERLKKALAEAGISV
jgi:RNA polymerase sigma-70 factor (ECF subfamily)